MKFCTRCGNQVGDDERFCPGCGAACAAVQPEPVDHPVPKKKKRKGKIIAVLCVLALVAGLAVGGYFYLRWYTSPEQQVLRALEAEDYDGALELFEEDRSLQFNEDLISALEKRITAIQEEFVAETVDFSTALTELGTIEMMGIDELDSLTSDARTAIRALNESRGYFSAAETFFASGKYNVAMKQYAKVIKEDSNYDTAMTKYAEAVAKYREQQLADAAVYANGGGYSNAIALLETALQTLPEDTAITEQIQLYEKAYQDELKTTALADAAKYAEQGDYASAITVLSAIQKEIPDDTEISAQLQSYRQANAAKIKADALAEAAAYALEADYLSAMEVLSDYQAVQGSDTDVELAYNGYLENYVDAVLDEAAAKVLASGYAEAIGVLRETDSAAQNHERLAARLSTYETEYATEIVAQSDALLEEDKYDEASDAVEAALAVIPDNAALTAQLTKIEDARPKFLLDVCEPYESDHFESYMGRSFQMAGNTYSNGLVFGGGYPSSYIYFNLEGKYTTLSFICGHIDGTDLRNFTLDIYCDGVLTYEIALDATGIPIAYELDITGVKQLAFSTGTYHPRYGLADLTVQ